MKQRHSRCLDFRDNILVQSSLNFSLGSNHTRFCFATTIIQSIDTPVLVRRVKHAISQFYSLYLSIVIHIYRCLIDTYFCIHNTYYNTTVVNHLTLGLPSGNRSSRCIYVFFPQLKKNPFSTVSHSDDTYRLSLMYIYIYPRVKTYNNKTSKRVFFLFQNCIYIGIYILRHCNDFYYVIASFYMTYLCVH